MAEGRVEYRETHRDHSSFFWTAPSFVPELVGPHSHRGRTHKFPSHLQSSGTGFGQGAKLSGAYASGGTVLDRSTLGGGRRL